jgi:hypothetical protein
LLVTGALSLKGTYTHIHTFPGSSDWSSWLAALLSKEPLLFFEDFQQEEASGVLLSSQAKDNQNSFGSPLVLQAWKNLQKICKIGL